MKSLTDNVLDQAVTLYKYMYSYKLDEQHHTSGAAGTLCMYV